MQSQLQHRETVKSSFKKKTPPPNQLVAIQLESPAKLCLKTDRVLIVRKKGAISFSGKGVQLSENHHWEPTSLWLSVIKIQIEFDAKLHWKPEQVKLISQFTWEPLIQKGLCLSIHCTCCQLDEHPEFWCIIPLIYKSQVEKANFCGCSGVPSSSIFPLLKSLVSIYLFQKSRIYNTNSR